MPGARRRRDFRHPAFGFCRSMIVSEYPYQFSGSCSAAPGIAVVLSGTPSALPHLGVRPAHPDPVPSPRARDPAPAGSVSVDPGEERSAPEVVEAVEPVEAEAVDAERGDPRGSKPAAPGAAADTADAHMADAGVAHADVAATDMAAADARRGVGRSYRQRERGARGKRNHRLTQHSFLLVRTPLRRPLLHAGRSRPDPHGHRLARWNTSPPRSLRCLRSTF